MDATTAGERVRRLRKLRGVTQQDLARLSRLSLRTIKAVEADEGNHRNETLHAVARALQAHTSDFTTPGPRRPAHGRPASPPSLTGQHATGAAASACRIAARLASAGEAGPPSAIPQLDRVPSLTGIFRTEPAKLQAQHAHEAAATASNRMANSLSRATSSRTGRSRLTVRADFTGPSRAVKTLSPSAVACDWSPAAVSAEARPA
jgi:DNA-binding XRE family transcriptional regulator